MRSCAIQKRFFLGSCLGIVGSLFLQKGMCAGTDLTLTGLARHRGKAYAYLSSGKSGESFTLKMGEDVATLHLESVDFKKGEAVVLVGEERLILALERRSREEVGKENPGMAVPSGPFPGQPAGQFPGGVRGRNPRSRQLPGGTPINPITAAAGSGAIPSMIPPPRTPEEALAAGIQSDGSYIPPAYQPPTGMVLETAQPSVPPPNPVAIEVPPIISPDDPLPDPTDH